MVDEELVKHIAHLARLDLSSSEQVQMQRELSLILDYIAHLNEIEVKGIEPFRSAVLSRNVMRADEAVPESSQAIQKIKDQFPRQEGAFLKVKTIL